MYISLLQAGGTPAGSGSMLLSMAPLIIIFAIMYLLMIRPQRKKEKELQKMIAAIKKGDKIVTIGGIHGTVSAAKEKTIVVKVDTNVCIEFSRSAIASVTAEGKPAKQKKAADAETDNTKLSSSETAAASAENDESKTEEAK
ncbi:MAG: preprotein translocase subunit YajC [Bacteroides sp.]|nr:preprotein translocase subunit YajC [Prevotella sp.]MCM1406894.1 preprotein translocase subunit YajC [Treponema brennaborense]MCM1470045.1 preprotein translocase subunit YajC [Bacteroides sp.]